MLTSPLLAAITRCKLLCSSSYSTYKPQAVRCREIQDHRIIQVGENHRRPPNCWKLVQLWNQIKLLRVPYSQVLKTSKDGDCTTIQQLLIKWFWRQLKNILFFINETTCSSRLDNIENVYCVTTVLLWLFFSQAQSLQVIH